MILLCIIFNMETIVRLLQSIFIGKKNEWPATEARQHYQDELLEKILAYIDETIHDSHYHSGNLPKVFPAPLLSADLI